MQIAQLFFILVEKEHHSLQKSTLQIDNLPRTLHIPHNFTPKYTSMSEYLVSTSRVILVWVTAARRVRGRSMCPTFPSFHLCFQGVFSLEDTAQGMLGMKSFLRPLLLKERATSSFRSAQYLLLEQQTLHWGAYKGDFVLWDLPSALDVTHTHSACFSHMEKNLLQKNFSFFFFKQKEINQHLKTFLLVSWYFQRNPCGRWRYFLCSH